MRRCLIVAAIGFAAAWPSICGSGFYVSVGAFALTFVVLAQSLNLAYGYVGLLSVGTTVFWAIGAYASARLSVDGVLAPQLAILAGGVVAALIAGAFGFVAVRRGRQAFTMLSFIALLAAGIIANNWDGVTGGTEGIFGLAVVPIGLSSWHLTLTTNTQFYFATLVLAVISLAAMYAIVTSSWGTRLRAVGGNEDLAASLGIDLTTERLRVLVIGGFFSGLIGGIYVFSITVADPSLLTLGYLAPLLGGVFLGGPGNFWGNIVATIAVVFLPQVARGVSSDQNLVYGLALLVLCVAIPNGLPAALRGVAGQLRTLRAVRPRREVAE